MLYKISCKSLPVILVAFSVCVAMSAKSQVVTGSIGTSGISDKIIATSVKGAPRLGKPILLLSESGQPLISEGHGWSAPAIWDWNKDGKKDLLIGEFTSGMETKKITGNHIRVYTNNGSDSIPSFSNEFGYARMVEETDAVSAWRNTDKKYPEQLTYYGSPISIPQFCCMAIQPQFADINNDGFPDLYAGSYTPGEVYWFRGTDIGFLQGEKLKQYGNASSLKKSGSDRSDPDNWGYWGASQVSFGDFTGDGLKDMIIGGITGLRISKNIGTTDKPEFGRREYLLDTQGVPLWNEKKNETANVVVADWNNDGVLDLIVTNKYIKKGSKAVEFYEGVKQQNEHRFLQPVSLLETNDSSKVFPGDYLIPFVADWNNDGINDLLIGTKVGIINGIFDLKYNWTWSEENVYSVKIMPGYYTEKRKKEIDALLRLAEKTEAEIGVEEMLRRKKGSSLVSVIEKNTTRQEILDRYYGGKEEFKTLIHHGYVYLMLGEKQ